MTQDISRVAMYFTATTMLEELANDLFQKDGNRTMAPKFSAHAFVMHRLDIYALLCATWDSTRKTQDTETQDTVCTYCVQDKLT